MPKMNFNEIMRIERYFNMMNEFVKPNKIILHDDEYYLQNINTRHTIRLIKKSIILHF